MTAAPDDVEVVRTVARGIIELADVADPVAFSLPYPPSAQRALDLLVNTLIRVGGEPPRSLPGMVRLCRTEPLREWGLRLPADLSTIDELFVLRQTASPSRLCLEWAHDGVVSDERVRDLLRALDEAAPDEETYEACRAFAVSRPMVPGTEFWELNGGRSRRVWRKVRDFYEPLPGMFVRDGTVAVCGSCSFPMIPVDQPKSEPKSKRECGWECEWESCLRDRPPSIHPVTDSIALPRGVRWAFCAPGRAEADVRRVAAARGAWMSYRRELSGALSIGWPGGEQWEVFIRNHVDPALLARSVSRSVGPASADRCLVVQVGGRLVEGAEFRSIFERNLAMESSGWSIVGTHEFADLAARAGTTGPG
ncbi:MULTISPECIES: hypothetical protein [unclassified Saccharopolyspora]|uniref:pPIWI_RE_Y domain-containing protein n=1 Tax=unclassified Saccharopolyspora TaxID=2646250 RepID=UPI001CD48C1B|nr:MULTISPECIES: hypothetical protein [unclassified Saccharopolyspora]MCA1186188.1 hypothetical protein [Saccharopolyspora sp. 6T]MCA1278391.1 hypothetical protein [Saccharopolyspora sp. 7B]